ncbi:hypothetical protein AND_008142 [Anopheles darlingi]|uniref:Uncharacterized protein n=1 Tax=Anopheles darlingi TaxID=43151 RepID=W5J8H8_ANODA|nr:hypothetical protein AND_008142 [Anopheles darlingi]
MKPTKPQPPHIRFWPVRPVPGARRAHRISVLCCRNLMELKNAAIIATPNRKSSWSRLCSEAAVTNTLLHDEDAASSMAQRMIAALCFQCSPRHLLH